MLLLGDREGFVVGYVEDEPIPDTVEGGYQKENSKPATEAESWSPVDWTAYSPSQGPVRQRPASHASTDSSNSSRSQKLPRVDERPIGSSSDRREADDTFEFRIWKKGSLVKS